MNPANRAILSVQNLTKQFAVKGGFFSRQRGTIRAVDNVSFEVNRNSSLGIVGESGSGKTTIGKCIIRLIEPTFGSLIFDGDDISKLAPSDLRKRRRDMQMIYQDPYSSLNPRMTVEQIVGEPFTIHKLQKGSDRKNKIAELLQKVGLTPDNMKRYPHQFSGGQRQRVGIARALALKPQLLIADEPVSALDVSVQAKVINLMMNLKTNYNLTYIIISHDLSVIKHMCDVIIVMYLGRVVEIAPCSILCEAPLHPYSQALISAVPKPDPDYKKNKAILSGEIPNPIDPPPGCYFHPRCPVAMSECKSVIPLMQNTGEEHYVACHRCNGI